MKYTGKLYGKIGKKYFDTGFTSEDYDNLIKENSELKKQVLNLPVSQQRELFYNFITWYNAKPFVKKPKDGLITTTIIEEYLKL